MLVLDSPAAGLGELLLLMPGFLRMARGTTLTACRPSEVVALCCSPVRHARLPRLMLRAVLLGWARSWTGQLLGALALCCSGAADLSLGAWDAGVQARPQLLQLTWLSLALLAGMLMFTAASGCMPSSAAAQRRVSESSADVAHCSCMCALYQRCQRQAFSSTSSPRMLT